MGAANAYTIDLADARMHAIQTSQPPVGHANLFRLLAWPWRRGAEFVRQGRMTNSCLLPLLIP